MVRKKEKKIKNEKYLDTNLEKKEKLWKPKLETDKNREKKENCSETRKWTETNYEKEKSYWERNCIFKENNNRVYNIECYNKAKQNVEYTVS